MEHLKGTALYAKMEMFNPGGSVKDRPALQMILDAEASGELTPDKVIIDSTSGNTGIAYAMVGAARGYQVELVMPANVSVERRYVIQSYGARLVLSDPTEGSDGAILKCREILAGRIRVAITSQTSTTTPPIPGPTPSIRPRRSGSRRVGGLPTLWPPWAPAAPWWVRGGV